jgi:hypothetical protein
MNLSIAQIAALTFACLATVASQPGCTPRITSTSPSPTGSQTQTTTAANHLAILQGRTTLTVDFFGLVTFQTGASTITFPTVFFVHGVPIKWSGVSFTGHLEEAGPGEDITDTVVGTVSADGNTLASLVYDRRIIRPSLATGTSYRVILRDVPLFSGSALGAFQTTGVDIRQYVSAIEYADGPVTNGQIVSAFAYVNTDWTNTGAGQSPTLKLSFGS